MARFWFGTVRVSYWQRLQTSLLGRILLSLLVVVSAVACFGGGDSASVASQAERAPTSGNVLAAKQLPGADLGTMMRHLRHAYQAKDTGFVGGDGTYAVRAEGGRITLTPYHHPRGPRPGAAAPQPSREPEADHRQRSAEAERWEGAPLALETVAVVHGDTELATSKPTSRVSERGQLEIDRGELVERFSNSEHGVEQSWTFEARPGGEGDLVVRVQIRGHEYQGKTAQGLHFVGREHGLGFRYGHATWIDAREQRASVEARWVEDSIELRIPSDVVERSSYPAVLDPVIGPEFGVDEPVYGPSSGASESEPSIASNRSGMSLVVWTVNGDIYGSRMASDGTVLNNGAFPICTAPGSQRDPAVSHDGTNWLVLWDDERNGSSTHVVYAARVSHDGTVLDNDGLAISSIARTADNPAVSHDGTNWLVVWQQASDDGNCDIYGARVSSGGKVLDPDGIAISTAARRQYEPAVSHDGANWLVVWRSSGSGPGSTVYGARVSSGGTVLDSNGIAINSTTQDQYAPAVSHDGTNWLVVWFGSRIGFASTVYGARVSSGGTVLDSDAFAISSATQSPENPVVSHDGTNWLVVWTDFRGGLSPETLNGARVSSNGSVLDSIVISTAERFSSAAVSYNGTNWFVVWAEGYGGPSDIEGARVSSTGTVLDSSGIIISVVASMQTHPAASYDGRNWLVVWQETRSGSADIYGAKVSSDGSVLDSRAIAISTATGDQTLPAVSHDGANWLVVWQDKRNGSNTDIYGARVSTDGTVLDSDGVLIGPAPSRGNNFAPAVSHNGTSWLVVWQQRVSLGNPQVDFSSRIIGARVAGSGAVLDNGGIAIGGEVMAKGAGSYEESEFHPAVSHDGTNWLVVWPDFEYQSSLNIYGARVAGDGTLLDSSRIVISAAIEDQERLAVSHDGTNWLVVWQDRRSTGFDIYGARVSGEGTVLDSDGIAISTAAPSQYSPTVSHDGTNWFVVWTEAGSGSTSGVYGTAVSGAGVLLDAEPSLLAQGTTPELSPAVARGAADSLILAYSVPIGVTSRVKARVLDSNCLLKSAHGASVDDASCDGIDNDCSGVADQDYVPVATACGVGACASTGTTSCVGGKAVDSCVAGAPAASDAICNGIDEDCSGVADEDYVPVATTCSQGACVQTGTTACVDGTVADSCVVDRVDSDDDNVANCEDLCPLQAGELPDGCPESDGTGGMASTTSASANAGADHSIRGGGLQCSAGGSHRTSGALSWATLVLALLAHRRGRRDVRSRAGRVYMLLGGFTRSSL